MLSNKKLGIGLMALAVVLFMAGFLYIRSAEAALLAGHTIGPDGECTHPSGAKCGYEQVNELAMPKFIALFLDIALFGFGLLLYLWKKPEERALSRAKKEAVNLGGEEGSAFKFITEAGGMMFQNELMARLEVSKVRMTRILDRLEQQGLIERKRRGMTNLVVVKQ